MKLLLIQPPVQDFYDTDIRLQPIGLAHLKAAVEKFLPGTEVIIKDFHQGWPRKTLPIPKALAYLRDYYAWPDSSPFSAFHHYYHFGAGFDVIAAEVERLEPDLVGISALFSPYYREVLETARRIKTRVNVPILAGGSHVSAMPREMLAEPVIDFVIRGEGERPLVEFLRTWQTDRNFAKVPNLGYKQDGGLFLNETEDNYALEELPFASLAGLDPQNYLFEKRPMSFVITSRSCPHKCSFCSVHMTFGTSYRRRSVDHVLSELKVRYAEGYRVFDFEDDNLTFYKDEMKTLCRALTGLFPKKDVQFLAMNGISYLSLDDELLRLMKEAGFTHLNLALVSSDVTVRETTKRPHTIEKYLQVVEQAHALGFKITSYQILGLPNETLESMIQTLVFNAAQPVLLGASMFYLTPNSPIAKTLEHKATADDVFKARLTAMAIETDEFSRDDIYTLFVTTRILNFLKGLLGAGSRMRLADAVENNHPPDLRAQTGIRLLKKLLNGEGLFAATRSEDKPLKHFKMETFLRVWEQLHDRTAETVLEKRGA